VKYDTPIQPAAPLNPNNGYAMTKTVGEHIILNCGLPFVSLRLANVFGPRNLSGAIPAFARNLMNRAPSRITDTKRDFIYVTDLVRVMLKAIDGDQEGVFHVSRMQPISIADLYLLMESEIVKDGIRPSFEMVPRPAVDVPTLLLDNAETRKAFDWEPRIDFIDGLRVAIEWYSKNMKQDTKAFSHIPGFAEKN
jgi:UDP-glucose 4-epimerase